LDFGGDTILAQTDQPDEKARLQKIEELEYIKSELEERIQAIAQALLDRQQDHTHNPM